MERSLDGSIRIAVPPNRKIGVIHLTYSSKMIGRYIEDGLLYKSGSYLSASELEALRALSHY
jgi:hypothetical protein